MNRKQNLVVGLQHFLSMFGATILVPLLTGLPVELALLASGVGTLIFHFITEHKVPAYLGSSFAFIAPIAMIVSNQGIPQAMGGVFFAGLVYVGLSIIIRYIGTDLVRQLFSPIVTGSIIILIGLSLAGVAVEQSANNPFLAFVAVSFVIFSAVFSKGFFKLIPIVIALVASYIFALILGFVDLSLFIEADFIGLPRIYLPSFDFNAIMIIAPVAFVTAIEHVGDVLAIGGIMGKKDKLLTDPGLDKTLLGDGIATLFASLIGAPPNTTYSENIGVLELSKVYTSRVVLIGAMMAILTSFSPKMIALINSIPIAILGGISLVLFGMIASVGIRTLVKNRVDFSYNRNLIILGITLILGLGGATFSVGVFDISSLAFASIIAVTLNYILPKEV